MEMKIRKVKETCFEVAESEYFTFHSLSGQRQVQDQMRRYLKAMIYILGKESEVRTLNEKKLSMEEVVTVVTEKSTRY